MSSKHYDIAIIGSSLAGRIAAALMAKNGQRVLLLRTQERPLSPWFYSSLFLEQLLGKLGGRSCFAAPQAFQVMSSKSRISIHNDTPLKDELIREFGETGNNAQQGLDDLLALGQKIETLLWDNGGLPMPGIKSAAKFRMLCMKHKIRLPELDTPLLETFKSFSEPIQSFLSDLFQGLSLKPASQLSLAHGALLWTNALRPESIKEPDFGDLLEKRFKQFHGASVQAEELTSIEHDGQKYVGGLMKEGARFTADGFILSTSDCSTFFPNDILPYASKSPTTIGVRTTLMKEQISPLLENRVIVGGDIPLRFFLRETQEETSCYIGYSGTPEESELRQQLEPVLPFAKYEMTYPEVSSKETDNTSKAKDCGPFYLPLKPGNNLYRMDSQYLLPTLGATGEALLGWTLANHLSRPKSKSQR